VDDVTLHTPHLAHHCFSLSLSFALLSSPLSPPTHTHVQSSISSPDGEQLDSVLSKTLAFVTAHSGLGGEAYAKLQQQVESTVDPILERIAASS